MTEAELIPEDRPIWRVVTALLALDPAHRGDRHYYRCPAHKDRSPSLSVSEGADGRALVHCFAGCTVGEICSALNLTVRDLFPGRAPEGPEGPRFERARGMLSAYCVKYPEIVWLIEQVREDRLFYLDNGAREGKVREQYPHIPEHVWEVLRK